MRNLGLSCRVTGTAGGATGAGTGAGGVVTAVTDDLLIGNARLFTGAGVSRALALAALKSASLLLSRALSAGEMPAMFAGVAVGGGAFTVRPAFELAFRSTTPFWSNT